MKKILALVGLLIAAQLPAAAAEQGPAVPQLAGTTTVVGTEVAAQVVELPQAVEVSGATFRNPLFDIDSEGRFAGVILRQRVHEDPVEVMGFRAALCDEPPCKEKPIAWADVYNPKAKFRPKRVTLPSGTYDLYVIAGDGQETRVRIDLPGLDGSTVVRPTGQADSTFGPMKEEVAESTTKVVYRGSAPQKIEGIGIAMAGIELETEALLYEDIETCLVEEDQAGDDAVSGSIACNGGGSGSFTVGRASPTRTVVISYSLAGEGSYTNSVSYRSLAQVKGFSTLDFSLSYGAGNRTVGRSTGIFHWDD
jgi:hypothetical protein